MEGSVKGLVLFDIDGTLLRAGDPAHKAAFISALRQVYGFPATLDGVPLAGMLDSQIARLALARHGLAASDVDARLVEAAALMGEAYEAAVAHGSRVENLLPGTVVLAEHLRDAGCGLGVLTGNVRSVARAKLAAAGIDTLLPVGAYSDTAEARSHLIPIALQDAERRYGTAFPTRTDGADRGHSARRQGYPSWWHMGHRGGHRTFHGQATGSLLTGRRLP